MLYDKTNWDYFCELLAVVPGLSAMFDDEQAYLSCKTPSDENRREDNGREASDDRGKVPPRDKRVEKRDRRDSVEVFAKGAGSLSGT